jgi:pimeloyl-ACP methyl ester carboxylesterase
MSAEVRHGVWSSVTGPEDAPVLVLVHGSMDRSTGLSRLARRFDEDHRIVRLDRRGYGRSAGHPGPYTVSDHVDDLLAVIAERIGDRSLHLFGHSFGGNVVLAASTALGDRVRSITVYESPLSWMDWWPGRSATAFAESDAADAAESFMRRLIGDARWERLPERTRVERRAEGPVLVGELTDLRRRAPWVADDITAPVLAMAGSLGADHHRRAATFLAEVLPDCRAVEVESARHFGPNSHPDEVAAEVRAHLAACGG